jgi:hypothetical protein
MKVRKQESKEETFQEKTTSRKEKCGGRTEEQKAEIIEGSN